MLPRLVPVEDEEVSKELLRSFKKQKINCEPSAKVLEVTKTDRGVRLKVELSTGKIEEVEGDTLLVAVGRKPNTDGVGIEKTKIVLDRGFVQVDAYQRTAEPGVYAIGDIVAGTPQLAHVATMEGMVAIGHIAGKPMRPINRQRIPGATYTEPGIGSVGLTEAQAREKGYDVKIGKFPFLGNSKASILGSHDGFVKVVADAKYGESMASIIGPTLMNMIAKPCGDGVRGDGRDDDDDDSRPPDAVRSSRRGVQQRLRPGDQCVSLRFATWAGWNTARPGRFRRN